MVNIFAKKIDPKAILGLQNLQYQEKLLLSDNVPAGGQKMGSVNISSLGHFYCYFMTGHFETLYDDAGATKDDGIVHLRSQMVDGSNMRPLFNDYIPLDLFLTPGRTKSADSTTFATDAVANNLFYPQQFQYMFTVNSEILFDTKNDGEVEMNYEIVFHGVRLTTARRR